MKQINIYDFLDIEKEVSTQQVEITAIQQKFGISAKYSKNLIRIKTADDIKNFTDNIFEKANIQSEHLEIAIRLIFLHLMFSIEENDIGFSMCLKDVYNLLVDDKKLVDAIKHGFDVLKITQKISKKDYNFMLNNEDIFSYEARFLIDNVVLSTFKEKQALIDFFEEDMKKAKKDK